MARCWPHHNLSEHLHLLSIQDRKSSVFTEGRGMLRQPTFSPDGHWLACASRESGAWEIFVKSFPVGHGEYQISTSGGAEPVWRHDGQELFYESADRHRRTANDFW
jgi:Tol biopolymer transport system component